MYNSINDRSIENIRSKANKIKKNLMGLRKNIKRFKNGRHFRNFSNVQNTRFGKI